MRGTHYVRSVVAFTLGITPAYAGNTFLVIGLGICTGDHPRVCGEHPTKLLRKPFRTGSPPRMRGTRLDSAKEGLAVRITPAYAGNTLEGLE